MEDGRWYFEATLKSGHHVLEVYNNFSRFRLKMDGRGAIEGSVNWLLNELPYKHRDPELNDWIMSCVDTSWKDAYQDSWIKRDFMVMGYQYKVKMNPRTGDVELKFPRQVILCDPHNVLDYHPELEHIEFGSLWEAIENTSEISWVDINTHDLISTRVSLPVSLQPSHELVINGWWFCVTYLEKRDLLFIELGERVVHTHAGSLHEDMPELEYLHGGAFEQLLINQLAEAGIFPD